MRRGTLGNAAVFTEADEFESHSAHIESIRLNGERGGYPKGRVTHSRMIETEEEITMSGYSVTEKRVKNARPHGNTCGSCGLPADKGKVLCQSCADERFFEAEAFQVETETEEEIQ
jgi:hypothetical protein